MPTPQRHHAQSPVPTPCIPQPPHPRSTGLLSLPAGVPSHHHAPMPPMYRRCHTPDPVGSADPRLQRRHPGPSDGRIWRAPPPPPRDGSHFTILRPVCRANPAPAHARAAPLPPTSHITSLLPSIDPVASLGSRRPCEG
ncbi:hypothetical protein VPH35_071535 [Triticum aestivum]